MSRLKSSHGGPPPPKELALHGAGLKAMHLSKPMALGEGFEEMHLPKEMLHSEGGNPMNMHLPHAMMRGGMRSKQMRYKKSGTSMSSSSEKVARTGPHMKAKRKSTHIHLPGEELSMKVKAAGGGRAIGIGGAHYADYSDREWDIYDQLYFDYHGEDGYDYYNQFNYPVIDDIGATHGEGLKAMHLSKPMALDEGFEEMHLPKEMLHSEGANPMNMHLPHAMMKGGMRSKEMRYRKGGTSMSSSSEKVARMGPHMKAKRKSSSMHLPGEERSMKVRAAGGGRAIGGDISSAHYADYGDREWDIYDQLYFDYHGEDGYDHYNQLNYPVVDDIGAANDYSFHSAFDSVFDWKDSVLIGVFVMLTMCTVIIMVVCISSIGFYWISFQKKKKKKVYEFAENSGVDREVLPMIKK